MSDPATLEFNLQIDKAAAKFGLSAERAMKIVALDAFERIIRRTPVGDPDYWQGHPHGTPAGDATPPPGYVGGNARNNWWLSINQPLSDPQGRPADKAESNAAYAEAAAGVDKTTLGDIIYFQNGVPYILKLEAGTGSPRQAPQGMVAVTLEELQSHFQQVLLGELDTP